MNLRGCVIALFALSVAGTMAAELEALEVSRNDGRLYVSSVITLAASPERIFDALTDYDRYAELTRRYRESRFVDSAADGTPRIYTRVEGCVLFFCRSIRRFARLETDRASGRIVARAEPEGSDVRFGLEQWQLEAIGDPAGTATRVHYQHELEPRFWVPPVIGVWLIRQELESSALSAAQKIEAQARSAPE